MNNEDYYIGLDVGTNSVGWALTDTDYNVQKFKGNAMWGIRLFDESKTAQERRSFRSARRRLEREKFRRQCLESIFAKEISKVDMAFFQRLKESNLYLEDKTLKNKNTLFADEDFNDKVYHKKYPTIYHLRKELIENKEEHDVRLVYLAISHIIKNRGHFLFVDELNNNSDREFKTIWDEFATYCNDELDVNIFIDNTDNIESILKDKYKYKKSKIDEIYKELGLNKGNKQAKAIISLVVGSTAKPCDLFDDESYKESEIKSISVSDKYDDNIDSYYDEFNEKTEVIEMAKAVYDWIVLSDIMHNHKYISSARVDIYEKHKADLKLLKEFVKTYCPDKYKEIFYANNDKLYNYVAYSKHAKDSPNATNCSQELFNDYLKNILPKDNIDEKYANMLQEIELKIFMPKIVSKENSVIPMQINKEELQAILNNASEYLPFLNEVTSDNKTNAQKIMDIFTYRIPYYVGPLNKHSDKSWLVRSNEKIYPWNYEKVIDLDASSERFIEELTNKCTYLYKEDVLPKESLVYNAFSVLNELNNVRIDGELLSIELKHKIFEQLFMKTKNVSKKSLEKFLVKNGYNKPVITGVDDKFGSSLKSFIEMSKFDIYPEQKEEIIKTITIFSDDKKVLRKRLKKKFGDILSDDDIKRIANLKFKGWARLSKKFLLGINGIIGETGEQTNIIRALWNYQYNLMQLLSNENTFINEIQKENGDLAFTTLEQEIDDLYVSPAVKRPINQSMKIIEELVKIKKYPPKKIFVEVAREKGEKKRTKSRKTILEELYKDCKKIEPDLYKLLQEKSEDDLRKDALYLYFTQMGRCMYTNKIININDIYNANLYDIDHIFPQSKIKDDSLDNRVLVTKKANEDKGDVYPLSSNIRSNSDVVKHWEMLLDKKLISAKKFERLVRNTALSEEELNAFINRQLVETRQSTKAIAELLKRRYVDTEIVYVKAGWVSDFRHKYDLLKNRDVNDYHHAKDAYLNIVVGNVYNTQFNHNRLNFIKGLQANNGSKEDKYSLNRLYDYDIKDTWVAKNHQSLTTVKNVMKKNNILYTRYAYEQKGGLFDQTLLKKGKGQMPISQNDGRGNIDKYGGFNKITATYFSVVSYKDKKDETTIRVIPIDLYDEKDYQNNPVDYAFMTLKNIDGKEYDKTSIKIVYPKLKVQSLISIDGFRMHISCKMNKGKFFACRPAMQLVLGNENEKYLKKLNSYYERNKGKDSEFQIDYSLFNYLKGFNSLTSNEKVDILKNKNLEIFNILENKLMNTIYNTKYSDIANKMMENNNEFIDASFNEQIYFILQMLNILHNNPMTGDLRLIGLSATSGSKGFGCKLKPNKDIDSFKVINQSITGLYEQEIELLK